MGTFGPCPFPETVAREPSYPVADGGLSVQENSDIVTSELIEISLSQGIRIVAFRLLFLRMKLWCVVEEGEAREVIESRRKDVPSWFEGSTEADRTAWLDDVAERVVEVFHLHPLLGLHSGDDCVIGIPLCQRRRPILFDTTEECADDRIRGVFACKRKNRGSKVERSLLERLGGDSTDNDVRELRVGTSKSGLLGVIHDSQKIRNIIGSIPHVHYRKAVDQIVIGS